jgi:predicted HicB family RNase H-like nuclease
MFEYKGYVGQITGMDEDQKLLGGRLLGIQDVVTFEGRTFDELIQAFRDSVDDYLDFCRELGQDPETPYSGKVTVHMPSELHRQVENAARQADMSVTTWIVAVVKNHLQQTSLNGNGSAPPSPRTAPAKKKRVSGR